VLCKHNKLIGRSGTVRVTAFVLTILILLSSFCAVCPAEEDIYPSEKELSSVISGIISWKSGSLSNGGNNLFGKLSPLAGSTAADWYAFSMGRMSVSDGAQVYLDYLKLYVEQKYKEDDRLSAYLSTEWHRIALTVMALGDDPLSFGKDKNGNAINLVRDGVYDRGLIADLGAQGISGYIWGLITVDAMRYGIPENSSCTREDIIEAILERQLADGGFALAGKVSDPDVTSMAVIALSTYINDMKTYDYVRKSDNKEMSATVKDVIDTAVDTLARMQTDDGEFRSYGQKNVKSACQVAVALCSVGTDIFKDERFIKNGQTLFDVIMRYRHTNGGFLDSLKDGAEPNSMSGEQVIYTLSAIMRFMDRDRKLFDMREDFSESMKNRLSSLDGRITKLSGEEEYADVLALVKEYCTLPKDERDYVRSYAKLYEIATENGIDIEKTDEETEKVYDSEGPENGNKDNENDNNNEKKPVITVEELSFISAFSDLDTVTTEHYQKLLMLSKKLGECEDFDGRESAAEIVFDAVKRIEEILGKIDRINSDISENAHPLEEVDSSRKDILQAILDEYNSLSEYDKGRIDDYEGLLTAYTKANSSLRGNVLLYASIGTIAVLVIALIIRGRIRASKRKREEADF